jgi:hypothetical protein
MQDRPRNALQSQATCADGAGNRRNHQSGALFVAGLGVDISAAVAASVPVRASFRRTTWRHCRMDFEAGTRRKWSFEMRRHLLLRIDSSPTSNYLAQLCASKASWWRILSRSEARLSRQGFIVRKLLSPNNAKSSLASGSLLSRRNALGGLKPGLAKEFNVDIKKRYRKTTSWLCR